MTGMKEGAGEDPFAEDEDTVEDESMGSAGTSSSDRSEKRTSSGSETSSAATRGQNRQQMQIPYKFRRDGVQDGRDRVPLFLQGETKSAEREALRELEERFDANVSLTDLREALVKVGLVHLDEVEGQLEQWGYGMTFDD
ncbi:MAG: hypothetical protein V5A56_14910 [Halolamina sp.]